MRSDLIVRGAAAVVLAALLTTTLANPYVEDEDGLEDGDDYENTLDRFLQEPQDKRSSSRTYMPMRRSCIRRGGNCDHQQEDCCYNLTCRCNLFGSNCRCQRMGLFQKWGK